VSTPQTLPRKNVDPSRKNRRKKHSYYEYECQRLDQQGHKVHRSGFHWETGKKILLFHTRREREKNTDPMFFFFIVHETQATFHSEQAIAYNKDTVVGGVSPVFSVFSAHLCQPNIPQCHLCTASLRRRRHYGSH
jgi:hypothetical protein